MGRSGQRKWALTFANKAEFRMPTGKATMQGQWRTLMCIHNGEPPTEHAQTARGAVPSEGQCQ